MTHQNKTKSQQKILAIETSTIACSAALLIQPDNQDSKAIIYEVWEEAPRQHTELLLPMLDEVLKQADCELSDIDVLAFGCGPGAFTGVRIATSVIQALSYASNCKVISVSSLAALAQGVMRTEGYTECVVASDARMNEVYLGSYQHSNGYMLLQGEEKLLNPELLGNEISEFCQKNSNWTAIGSGWQEYEAIIAPQISNYQSIKKVTECLPHAQDIAMLAVDKLNKNQFGDAQTALPVYLRNDVAKKSVKNSS
jgi:tRNA threonylcarbamoyladenosine biosynthesis protein TsaB